jgi:hypothetical protein
MLSASTDMPEAIKEMLLEVDTTMSVKTISAACHASAVKFETQEGADEMMEWAQRLISAEIGGVNELIKGAKKK